MVYSLAQGLADPFVMELAKERRDSHMESLESWGMVLLRRLVTVQS